MAATTWPIVPLGQLVENGDLSYGIVQPGSEDPDGVPIVRVKDLGGGRVSTRAPLRVAPAISERHSRTVLRGSELLVSVVGTVGETAVVPPSLAGWNVARAIAVVRPEGVSANWIRLVLQTRSARTSLDGVLNTTVQATLNLADLKRLPIPIPPENTRRAIAEVLGALDDKIAANDDLVGLSQGLADAIFARPVHGASDSGSTFDDVAQIGGGGTPRTSVELVPLSSLARFVNGKAFTKNATGTGRMVVRIAELNSGIGGSTVYNDIDVEDDHLARPGDLLFAWSGSLTVARWYRPEAIVNQHIFKVVPEAGVPIWLVNQAVRAKLDEFRAIAADKATTMGHIQRHHLDAPVLVPSAEDVKRIDALMASLWDTALAAEIASLKVAQTRDELLPLLMSGKIRVRDAEKIVEEAV